MASFLAGKKTLVLNGRDEMSGANLKFVADRMLGKLAKYLVMLGTDTLYFTENSFAWLIELSKRQDRVILTRNGKAAKLLPRCDHVLVKDDSPEKQLRQVVKHFDLPINEQKFFSRCLRCNRSLEKITVQEASYRVPPYIQATQGDFSSCPECGRVYWRGTHCRRMGEGLRRLLFAEEDVSPHCSETSAL
jgi:hypothetical protein